MIILGASMTPQLQVGLEGWVFHRPDQWFGKGWGSYDIHLPSTDFFRKQIYNQEIHKILGRNVEMYGLEIWCHLGDSMLDFLHFNKMKVGGGEFQLGVSMDVTQLY